MLGDYRGTSLIRNTPLLEPHSVQWDYTHGPTVVLGKGLFLMSEVPL